MARRCSLRTCFSVSKQTRYVMWLKVKLYVANFRANNASRNAIARGPSRDELHEPSMHCLTLRAMWLSLKSLRTKFQTSLPKAKSSSTSRNDFSNKFQVALATCTAHIACDAMARATRLTTTPYRCIYIKERKNELQFILAFPSSWISLKLSKITKGDDAVFRKIQLQVRRSALTCKHNSLIFILCWPTVTGIPCPRFLISHSGVTQGAGASFKF